MATTIYTPSMLRGAGTRGVPEVPAGSSFENTYSMDFDGVDDYIDIDSQVEWGPVSSISLWFKKDVATSNGVLLGGTNNYNYTLFAVNEKLYQWFGTTNSVYTGPTTGANTLRTTDWVHIAVVRYTTTNPGDSVELYINGTSVYTNPAGVGSYWIVSKVQRFGARMNGADKFNGKIDEVALFDSALSSGDITTIYNSGTPGDLTSLSPLGWWRMGEKATWDGTDWTLTDQGSGGNDATSDNMVEANRETNTP